MLIIKRYTASWCGPCKQLTPVFEDLQKEISDVSFQTIDVDQNKEMTLNEGVRSVPTVIFEKDGEQVHRFSGFLPKSMIEKLITKYK